MLLLSLVRLLDVEVVVLLLLSTLTRNYCRCPSIVCPPIDKAQLPIVEVRWRRTQKVDDFYRHPSPVWHSTFNTFEPHPTISFDVRRHVCKTLRVVVILSVGLPILVHESDPVLDQSSSVADSWWVLSMIAEQPGIKILYSSSWYFPWCRPCQLRLSRLPPLLVSVGAIDASAAPVLLVSRCNEDWRSWWESASSHKYDR